METPEAPKPLKTSQEKAKFEGSGPNWGAESLQIVGMSATLPNADVAASWLGAAHFSTDFRPVPLKEYIFVGPTLLEASEEGLIPLRNIKSFPSSQGSELGFLGELSLETIREGKGVLVFCSSRTSCENTAKNLVNLWGENGVWSVLSGGKEGEMSGRVDEKRGNERVNMGERMEEVRKALEEVKKGIGGLCEVLEETVPKGVAYHHAGLTVQNRILQISSRN